MSRRANGEGTITKRKDGRWEAAAYVPTIQGVRKRLRVYAPDRQQAHAKLVEKLENARRGIPALTTKLTVGEFLDQWLEEVVPKRTRRNTAKGYEAVVRLHIKPRIGHFSLKNLSVRDVQKAVDDMTAEEHSPRTVEKFRQVLSAALGHAMRDELIMRNVARLIDLPPVRRKEIRPWTAEEAGRLLVEARNHGWYVGYLMLFVYGMREGEVVGLRWQDIDFTAGELTIRQQIQRVDGALAAVPVKTHAGNRPLPLVPIVRDALLTHAAANGIDIVTFDPENAPESFTTTGTVLTSFVGTPIEPRGLLRTFDVLIKRANLRRITIHHARHTVATLLDTLGVSPKDAQLILGHSNISTTQQIYQHGNRERQREALQAVSTSYEKLLDNTSEDYGDRAPTSVDDASRSRQTLPSNVARDITSRESQTPASESQQGYEGESVVVPRVGIEPTAKSLEVCSDRPSTSEPINITTSVVSIVSRLRYNQLKSLEIELNRLAFGQVAVRNSRQTVSSPVLSGADVNALLAIRRACRDAMTEHLRRRSFPLNLIPDSTQHDYKEAA